MYNVKSLGNNSQTLSIVLFSVPYMEPSSIDHFASFQYGIFISLIINPETGNFQISSLATIATLLF